MIAHNKVLLVEDDDADTLDAFVAMGGNADKSGFISADKLRATVRGRLLFTPNLSTGALLWNCFEVEH